jgi:hypothetical protein
MGWWRGRSLDSHSACFVSLFSSMKVLLGGASEALLPLMALQNDMNCTINRRKLRLVGLSCHNSDALISM